MHWRCTSMVGPANECELQPALASDRIHDSQRSLPCLQNRTLLDVEFHVAKIIVPQSSPGNLLGIQSKLFYGAPNGNSSGIFTLQKLSIEPSRQGPAADKRHAKANSFLLGEANDLNSERKPASLESFQQCHRKHHAENSIVGSGIGNRVEM